MLDESKTTVHILMDIREMERIASAPLCRLEVTTWRDVLTGDTQAKVEANIPLVTVTMPRVESLLKARQSFFYGNSESEEARQKQLRKWLISLVKGLRKGVRDEQARRLQEEEGDEVRRATGAAEDDAAEQPG